MRKFKDSAIGLDEAGFNNCPARNKMRDLLRENVPSAKFVDLLDIAHWQNVEDTVVIAIPNGNDKEVAEAMLIANDEFADEIHHLAHDKYIIIRMWWD